MVGNRDKRIDYQRVDAKIFDSLVELMATVSLDKITVKDIAATAGVSRAAFYMHFADKYAVVEKLEERLIDELVGFSDLAGETFLVMDGIGFWKDVYEQGIPDVKSIVQRDREVFEQLVCSSDILCFTTDAPQNRNHAKGRVAVPISDAGAHATFFLVTLKGAPENVSQIADWVQETDA